MMAGLERRHVAGWYSVAIAVEVMNLACTVSAHPLIKKRLIVAGDLS